jgi:glycosyltransferase involved in cell wall biosynthesis
MILLKRIVKKLIHIIKKIFNLNLIFHIKGFKKYDIILYDNIYPHPISGFRLEEFTYLLNEFKNSKILLCPKAYSILKTDVRLHTNHISQTIDKNKKLTGKLKLRKGIVNLNTKLFYCIFLDNIYEYYPKLEQFEIPFVFTLYPGGGFQINNECIDNKLKRVLSSPYLKKVIVTQNIIKDYLIEKQFCNENKIELIFGCVVPQQSLDKENLNRLSYSINKKSLDIGFCAGKYMPNGKDKGYDVFIELAKSLARKYDFIKFHVIGGFEKEDIEVNEIKDKIKFHGYQIFENLESLFKGIDIIISPNKSFILNEGSFDGFPLGTVIEAVLNGSLAIVSDDLNQNNTFVNYEELIITKSDYREIEIEIKKLIENPSKILEIAKKGKLKFQEVYSNNNQMTQRIKLFNNILKELN